MLINRNNYESFFLLYVDGELCAAEMKMVEDFAAANKDLGTELEMLQAAVLPPDDILFEDKGELYKPIPIDSILHEKLLLKIDNELPQNEEGSLNELIAADENVKGEFNLLQLTKLDAAERIVFADKHLLYRKEKDNVVIGRFARWAAAAVLLGFGFYFGANMLSRKNVNVEDGGAIAGTKVPSVNKGTGTNTTTATIIDPKNTAALNGDTDVVNNSTAENPAGATAAAQNSNAAQEKKSSNSNAASVTKDNINPKDAIAQQDATPAQRENIAPVQKINDNPVPQIALVSPKEIKVQQLPVDNTIVPLEDPYSKYVALGDNDKSNNKILYMDEDDVKRSKVGGFFRKVKRFAERTAKVKTGNTLRIAGFAIASK